MSCTRCNDAGMVMTNEGMLDCACRKERRLAQAIERSGIPARYRAKTFEQYQTAENRSAAEALLYCRRFVEEWPVNREMGLLLYGPIGVGKTHLATAVMLECHRRYGASIAFVDLPQLFTKIKATFDQGWMETEMEILRPLIAADILTIDELAAARHSDWNFAMTEQILNARYNDAKTTILTTNFIDRPLGWKAPRSTPARPQLVGEVDFAARAAEAAPQRRETLGDRIGARMYSRTQEMCVALEIEGEDRRAMARNKRS